MSNLQGSFGFAINFPLQLVQSSQQLIYPSTSYSEKLSLGHIESYPTVIALAVKRLVSESVI